MSKRNQMQTTQQDYSSTKSFFRLPREIRDKVYFLSTRPDCWYSFGSDQRCNKEHIHQSARGRVSAVKWLLLCRQTWAEAISYMPLCSNEIRVRVAGDLNRRCYVWDIVRPSPRSGMVHAPMNPRIHNHDWASELAMARTRSVTLELKTSDTLINHEPDYYRLFRFAHNLSSVTSTLAKMPHLSSLTLTIDPTFANAMTKTSYVANGISGLFSIVKVKISKHQIDLIIEQVQNWPLSTGSSSHGTEGDEESMKIVRHIAATVGLNSSDIRLSVLPGAELAQQDGSHWQSFFESECDGTTSRYPVVPIRRLPGQAFYKITVFDDDFQRVVLPRRPDDWPTYMQPSGRVSADLRKYSFRREVLPLYLEEDFRLGPTNLRNYSWLPECSICRVIFVQKDDLAVHTCVTPAIEVPVVVPEAKHTTLTRAAKKLASKIFARSGSREGGGSSGLRSRRRG